MRPSMSKSTIGEATVAAAPLPLMPGAPWACGSTARPCLRRSLCCLDTSRSSFSRDGIALGTAPGR
eukprot:359820-Chlamydomonas_euryale.AAC.3